MNNYTGDILDTLDLTALCIDLGLESITPEEFSAAYSAGGLVISPEDLCRMIKHGVPIDPFLVGSELWKECVSEKRNKDEREKKYAELLREKITRGEKRRFPLNKEAYCAFLEHREKTIKKKVTEAGARKQKKLLRSYPVEVQRQIIDKAISRGHEGLFHPSDAELKKMESRATQQQHKAPEKENEMTVGDIVAFFGTGEEE